jgi:hypothetical protein
LWRWLLKESEQLMILIFFLTRAGTSYISTPK